MTGHLSENAKKIRISSIISIPKTASIHPVDAAMSCHELP